MSTATLPSSSHPRSSFVAPPARVALQDPFSEEEPAEYVLHFGFQGDRAACKQQDEAFFNVQRKVVQREDAAQALLLSANVLAMSVMASQLTMYRWKVSEAQTVNEATAQLQEMVASVTRSGFQVRRERPKPLKLSKYADGEGLKRLYERNMAKLERRRERREAAAGARGRAAEIAVEGHADADDVYNTLLKSSSSSSSDDDDDEAEGQDGAGKHHHHHHHRSGSAGSSSASSVCSADLAGPSDGKRKLPPAPPDAIPRLVLVDRFTHESFAEIAQNLRFFDERFGLQLVLVLLMPEDNDALTVQGAGTVVSPQHDISVEEAYAAGYDLVLRHHFDHIVVNFLSHLFVSSAGRWRGDIRAKAAVGNYLSLKNVLLGRIDTEALQQLVWKESVDDAELLQQLGRHTLALHGEAKRYGAAGQQLSQQVGGVTRQGGADVLTIESPDEVPLEDLLGGANMLGTLPHLRTGQNAATQGGVRNVNQRAFLPLEGLTITKDELQHRMDPSDRVQHSVKQLRPGSNTHEGGSAYEYLLIDEKDENRALLMTAIEEEMTRLVAENDQKTTAARHLQEDVTRLQRTVEVLRRQRTSGGSGSFGIGGGGGGGGFDGETSLSIGAPGRRPDSGSLVNLTKEQQIYVLKERLDQANDQIVALLDGTGRVRPNSGTRRGGSGGRTHTRGGGPTSSRGGVGSRRLPGQEKARAQAHQRYQEHREAELMGLQDDDALWKSGQAGDLPASALLNMNSSATGSGAGSPRRGMDPAEVAAQRREREATHRVVLQLQEELTQMQARAGSGTAQDTARLVHRLEEALKRLEAQNARIAQLEELRRMDDAFFQAELKRARQKADGAGRPAEAGEAGGKKGTKGRKTKTAAGGPRRHRSEDSEDEDEDEDDAPSRTAGNGNGGGRPPVASGKKKKKANAAASAGAGISAAAHAEALEALRDALTAEHEAALDAMMTQQTRDQRTREAALRARLNRLYQHIRRPCTQSYARLLEEQQAFAEAHAKDAHHRLEFALSHLKAHQLRTAPLHGEDDKDMGQDGSSTGIITRVSDPVAREKIETLASEYAQHAAQAAEAQRDLEALRPQLVADNVHSRVAELMAQREASVTAMAHAAGAPGGSLGAYLAAVEALQAVDQQLARWVDVDAQPALRAYASAAQGASATSSAPPALMSVTTTVVEPASAGASSTTSQEAVPIAVSDVALRELGEAYRVATVDGTAGRRTSGDSSRKKPRTGSAESGRAQSAGSLRRRRRPLSSGSRQTDGHRRGGPLLSSSRGSSVDIDSHRMADSGTHTSHSSPRSTRRDREAPQATVAALTGHADDIVAALEDGVVRGLLSPTQQRWYGLLLDRYERGYIHPDRMMDLDLVATLRGPSAAPATTMPEEKNNDDEEGESALVRAQRVCLSVHREVQRLLLVLTAHFPAIMPVAAACTPRVEAGLTDELARLASTSAQSTEPCTAPVFVAAADAARLTWVVDYLGLVLGRVHHEATAVKARARLSTSEDEAVLEMLQAVQAQRVLYHSHPQDPLVTAYTTRCEGAAEQYEEGEGGWWATPSQALDAANPYNPDGGDAEALDGVQAYLNAKRAELGVDPEALGYTADDLAALFSRKVKDQQELADLLPADLYEGLDDCDDPAYADMMRGIRGELEYLNALKQQRMEELVLQYRLRQRERGEGEKHLYPGRPGSGGDANGDPYAGRAVPEFDVKEGEPAWYGMEAARRVKNILRRKRKPDQIVLDGGPGGGNVGIELSRRTAFPQVPQRDVSVSQSAFDRLQAARTAALPPLRRSGLSRQQQQQSLAESGYSPRDVSNYKAYQRVLAHSEFDNVSPYGGIETPAEMAARLMQYRASLGRAASRLGGGARVGPGVGDAWIAQQLGAPYYLPIATGSGDGASRGGSGGRQATVAGQPMLTTWTYGVPSEQLAQFLQAPVGPDGQDATTTVVLPHESSSQLARAATTVNLQRHSPASRARVGASAAPSMPSAFVSGASAYTSPAALAAQRLSAMLHLSMEDPTVAAWSRLTHNVPLTGTGPGAKPATSYADLAQTRRASQYAAHRRDSQALFASPRTTQAGLASPIPPSATTNMNTNTTGSPQSSSASPPPTGRLSPAPPARRLPPAIPPSSGM